MCMYCERRQDVTFGWDQPKLPYHGQLPSYNLSGNALDNDRWNGVIHDYQTASPVLILTCDGYFDGEGVGNIHIPIKYCPECGRKLGKIAKEEDSGNMADIEVKIERLEKEIEYEKKRMKTCAYGKSDVLHLQELEEELERLEAQL